MIAETSGDAVVYKYVRGAGLLYTENAADEKTWYVKDAHGDTVQWTDSNKTDTSLRDVSFVVYRILNEDFCVTCKAQEPFRHNRFRCNRDDS